MRPFHHLPTRGLFSRLLMASALPLLVTPAHGAGLELIDVERRDAFDGPVAAAWSPDGAHLYVADHDGDRIFVLTDEGTGSLVLVQELLDGAAIEPGGDLIEGLRSPVAVAPSPDGAHVYASGHDGDAILAFTRDAATGTLSLAAGVYDGIAGVSGLAGVWGVALDPTGNHLYAVSERGDSLLAFGRDHGTGALDLLQVETDGVGGVEGLEGARGVAVSADGGSVYVASYDDRALAVFRRNRATGRVRFVEAEVDGAGGLDGLDGAYSVAVSEDGDEVFTVGFDEAALAAFDRDSDTGALTWSDAAKDGVDGADGLTQPNDVATLGGFVHAVGDNAVSVWERDPVDGSLTLLQLVADGVDGVDGLLQPTSLALSSDGSSLYAVSLEDAIVVLDRVPDDGSLTFREVHFDDQLGVDGLDWPQAVVVSPDGLGVFVASYFDDAVAVFDRAADGSLSFDAAYTDQDLGFLNGASGVAVSPDDLHVYVASEQSAAVAAFTRDPATNDLTFVGAVHDGVDGADGLSLVTDVAVSPDGLHVYAVAGGGEDAVTVLARDVETGELTFLATYRDSDDGISGLDGVEAVAVTPDGTSVLTAARTADSLVRFDRDPVTGALSFVRRIEDGDGGVDGLEGALAVAVHPDGDRVVVAAEAEDELSVFRRTPPAGALEYLGVLRDDEAGVDGLDRPQHVQFSADGDALYVASLDDDAVAVFARNAVTGRFGFRQAVFDGGGIDGLDGAAGLALAPIDSTLAVAARYDRGVSRFDRDPLTGELAFLDVTPDDLGGTPGLDGAADVAVGPFGDFVYVTAEDDDSLLLFDRDAATGETTFRQVLSDDQDGVDGLRGAVGVAASPLGHEVYAVGEDDDALVAFGHADETRDLVLLGLVRQGDSGADGLDGVRSVAVSPGGEHVYTASSSTGVDAVALFEPGPTGPKFLDHYADGVDAECLDGASDVTVSPNGLCLYVAAAVDDAVCVFERDPSSGALAWVQEVRDEDDVSLGLDSAAGVAVSPDGISVYVSGWLDDEINHFSADPVSCLLAFERAQGRGSGLFFDGPDSIAVSPDGRSVWVALQISSAVASFSRDPTSGALTYVGSTEDADLAGDVLRSASAVAPSPDGLHLYASAASSDALSAYRVLDYVHVDFSTQPDPVLTNLPTYLVTGSAEPGSVVTVNGVEAIIDSAGNYAATVGLEPGDNLVELVVTPPSGLPETVVRTLHHDPELSTASSRLLLVDVVDVAPISGDDPLPSAPGTWVIDLDQGAILGLLADRHVRGVSPDGAEVYFEDRSALDGGDWSERAVLAFAETIPHDGFVVGPLGSFLYSRDEKLDRAANQVVCNFPTSIVSGSQWAGAAVPGGPAIRSDGAEIACCQDETSLLLEIPEECSGLPVDLGTAGRTWQSDLTYSPDHRWLAKVAYAGQTGSEVEMIDAATWQRVATTPVLTDFAGEAVFSPDGDWMIVGSRGNAAFPNGKLSLIDTTSFRVADQLDSDLSDNLALSARGEIFVSSGNRSGIESFEVGDSGRLVRTGTWVLGVNRSIVSSGSPKYDQIRRIVLKPASSLLPEEESR